MISETSMIGPIREEADIVPSSLDQARELYIATTPFTDPDPVTVTDSNPFRASIVKSIESGTL